ncbi:hypothetical protein E2C01_024371 [Portunus trituberculatus]|uniref:Uncharacterized protein n=1 Tax=Portunus trituberculatus TaxID=210409 RepID=A0A5B7EEJ5_PORTR|nr:hypothetical protein [Portunus trituberculatus]
MAQPTSSAPSASSVVNAACGASKSSSNFSAGTPTLR